MQTRHQRSGASGAEGAVPRRARRRSRQKVNSPEAMMIAAPVSVQTSGRSLKTVTPMISAKISR
jgi:hypothetical protein